MRIQYAVTNAISKRVAPAPADDPIRWRRRIRLTVIDVETFIVWWILVPYRVARRFGADYGWRRGALAWVVNIVARVKGF